MTFKKILVATDLTEASDQAVRTAFALAAQLGAELVALHVTEAVYESRVWFSPGIEKEVEILRGIERREAEAAKVHVEEAVKRLGGRGGERVTVRSMVMPGVPADAIPQIALELGATMVANRARRSGGVGAHG